MQTRNGRKLLDSPVSIPIACRPVVHCAQPPGLPFRLYSSRIAILVPFRLCTKGFLTPSISIRIVRLFNIPRSLNVLFSAPFSHSTFTAPVLLPPSLSLDLHPQRPGTLSCINHAHRLSRIHPTARFCFLLRPGTSFSFSFFLLPFHVTKHTSPYVAA